MRVKTALALFCLAVICASPLLAKPSVEFADVNKDGVVDGAELKVFSREKIKIFDADRNGKLDAKELNTFDAVDRAIANEGKGLEAMDSKTKALYKKWRQVLLSLALKSEKTAGKYAGPGGKNQDVLEKCDPDKICDDPTSPYYGRKDGVPGASLGPPGPPLGPSDPLQPPPPGPPEPPALDYPPPEVRLEQQPPAKK
jgi:hypothetical protein